LFLPPERQVAERHTKVLFLPLAADGETVNMLLVVQVFFYLDWNARDRHFIESRQYKEIAHALLSRVPYGDATFDRATEMPA
jgi:hypothetical protein